MSTNAQKQEKALEEAKLHWKMWAVMNPTDGRRPGVPLADGKTVRRLVPADSKQGSKAK